MKTRITILLFVTFMLTLTLYASGVEGEWITKRADAMEKAKKEKKPILAVAMDHG